MDIKGVISNSSIASYDKARGENADGVILLNKPGTVTLTLKVRDENSEDTGYMTLVTYRFKIVDSTSAIDYYKPLVEKGYSSSVSKTNYALKYINTQRKKKGLSAISLNSDLSKVAGYILLSQRSVASLSTTDPRDVRLKIRNGLSAYGLSNMIPELDKDSATSSIQSIWASGDTTVIKNVWGFSYMRNALLKAKSVGIYVTSGGEWFFITSGVN